MPFTKDRSIYVSKRYFDFQDSSGSVTGSLKGASALLFRTRTGVSCPDYRNRIKRQLNATTDLSGTFDSYQCVPGVWYLVRQDNNFPPATRNDHLIRTRLAGDLAGAHNPVSWWTPTITPDVAINRASTAFLKKCRAVQREFSSPIFLGELRETIRMIRRPAQGLRNLLDSYLRDVKTSKKKNPRHWKKNLGDQWLEGMFGWLPLAHDLSDGYKAYQSLVNQHDDEQKLVSAIGIEEREDKGRSSSTVGTFPSGASTGFKSLRTVRASEKAFVKYRGMIVRRVDATLRDKLARVGFDPSEFLPTAWELCPWSFLFDYFTNIGDIIETSAFNRALLAWTNSDVITSQKLEGYYHFTIADLLTQGHNGAWFRTASGSPVSFIAERRRVNRSANASIPQPEFTVELPGSPFQYANMTALLASASSIHPQSYRR